MKRFRRKFTFGLFLLLIVLLAASNHPTIVQMSRSAGIIVGSILSRYIIFVYALLFLCCFQLKELTKSKYIVWTLIMLLLLGLYALLANALYSNDEMFGDIRAIGICVAAISVGWMMVLDYKHYLFLIVAFSLITTFVGLSQVFVNIGGFVIEDSLLTDNKNSLGVMLATSAFILCQLYSNSRRGDRFRILLPFIVVLLFVIMLTTRVRSAILIFVFMLFFSLFEHKKRSEFGIYLIISVVVVALIFVFMPSGIREFIYDSFMQNSGGDITSGRMARNQAGISFLQEHFLTGSLGVDSDIKQVHNYPLNRLCAYGLLFSFPVLLIYIYLLFADIRGIIKSNAHDNWNIGYYSLLIPFINSLSEPTLPFGPGTATVFNFILFGISLKYTYLNKVR